MTRKNQARITYKGNQFLVWQDDNLNWCYTFEELANVPTSSKELQAALNMIYETIDERKGFRQRTQRPKLGGRGQKVVRKFDEKNNSH
jgi:hypothetical protein